MSNRQAAQKIKEAVEILREAEQLIDSDSHRKNGRVVHLIRFIGSSVARRLDPELDMPEVYPWERS